MRVGMVTAHHYPSEREVRLAKMARCLYNRGHECLIFCPGKPGDKAEENFEHGRIQRRIRSVSNFSILTHSPIPCHPSWTSWLERMFRTEALDVVITRDLRLSLPAIWAAHRIGVPAVLDIAEHYPGLMKIVSKGAMADATYRNPHLISWLEHRTVAAADQVWVVCEENAARLRGAATHIKIISNYPTLSEISSQPSVAHRPYSTDPSGDPVQVVSFGLINEIRGLDLTIEAFALIRNRLPAVRLVIFGDGPMRPFLERRGLDLRIDDIVEFQGFVPFEERYQAIGQGDIGIIFHKVCELTNHTVPNKLFDYMSAGLPVCATPMRPVARIIQKEKCGLIAGESPGQMAEALSTLILDHELRRRMGMAGRHALLDEYLWEHQEDLIESALRTVISRRTAKVN